MLKGLQLLCAWGLLALLKRPVDDETACNAGRLARRYRRKKQIVRSLWLATALMMLAFPAIHFVVTLGLFTTFLSFTILDESV